MVICKDDTNRHSITPTAPEPGSSPLGERLGMESFETVTPIGFHYSYIPMSPSPVHFRLAGWLEGSALIPDGQEHILLARCALINTRLTVVVWSTRSLPNCALPRLGSIAGHVRKAIPYSFGESCR